MWFGMGTSMDPSVKEKEKFYKLEKVQKNLMKREKEHKNRIDEIIKRGDKKEKAKEKILKNKIYFNEKAQEKRTNRIMNAKKHILDERKQQLEDGQTYYKNIFKEIDERQLQKINKERAKSANIYQSSQNQA